MRKYWKLEGQAEDSLYLKMILYHIVVMIKNISPKTTLPQEILSFKFKIFAAWYKNKVIYKNDFKFEGEIIDDLKREKFQMIEKLKEKWMLSKFLRMGKNVLDILYASGVVSGGSSGSTEPLNFLK